MRNLQFNLKKKMFAILIISMVVIGTFLIYNIVCSAASEQDSFLTSIATGYAELKIGSAELGITKLKENVYHIDEATKTKPAGPSNQASSMYLLVDGEEAILVDGGNGGYSMDGKQSFGNTNAVLQKIISYLAPNKRLKVLITHGHGDHVGVLKYGDEKLIPKSTEIFFPAADLGSSNFAMMNKNDLAKFSNVITYKNDENIKITTNHTFKVLSIPVHTSGSNALIDQKNELIFTGDSFNAGQNLVTYSQAVDKLIGITKDMQNPGIYSGHRWQQLSGGGNARNLITGDINKEYLVNLQKLFAAIANGTASKVYVQYFQSYAYYLADYKVEVITTDQAINNYKQYLVK